MVKGKKSLARNVAKGAAGVAVTAGLVAVGAALMDQEVRENVTSNAQKGIKTLRDTLSDSMDEEMGGYESVAHEIRPGRSRKARGRRKTTRKAK